MTEYDQTICNQLKNGIVEMVPEINIPDQQPHNPIHYMPHLPVIRKERSTTKVRVVYDGSTSPGNKVSLNDCLQKGQNLVPKLLNVLIRFCNYPVALIADIEKAF